VVPSAITQQADAWKSGKRGGALARLLQDAGYDEDLLYEPVDTERGRVHAYTDSVSTIIIEYYALDVGSDGAKRIYRVFARQGLREFIYRSIGYDPRSILPPHWREFHDRLLLATAPSAHFSVLREMSEFVLRAIQNGLPVSNETVPDISVGQVWGRHWEANKLAAKLGERQRWEHNYPDYYPQSQSNPQEIWVYPVEALATFRRWLDEIYIPEKFPSYLDRKVKQKLMARAEADHLLAAVTPALLSDDEGDE